ncbi:MAG: biotin/lipoyl-binding protein [Verrucomicrobiae bacterium]|nr:biotin/lipoyl-binding protein [Verrucomicrobiae bacterium]
MKTSLPKNEWDFFLQSPMRLAEGVDLRFDLKGGRCLHDRRSMGTWCLDPWQSLFLRELERGASFGDAVQDTISRFPEEATRQAITELVNGLRHRGFLHLDRPHRSPSKRLRTAPEDSGDLLFSFPLTWACQLAFGAVLAIAGSWGVSSAISSDDQHCDKDFFPPLASEELAWANETDADVAVRIWCHGIITEILVTDGDEVKPGDVLALVVDPMAQSTRDDLRRMLGECRMRRDRFYASGDPVAYLRESKALARLTRELSEWEQQSGAISLRAPIEGRVRLGEIRENVGDRVSPGEVLMTIQTPDPVASEKEELLVTAR